MEKVYDTLIKYDVDQWDLAHQNAWIFMNTKMSLEMVKGAEKDLETVIKEVREILTGKVLTSYNTEFDLNKFITLETQFFDAVRQCEEDISNNRWEKVSPILGELLFKDRQIRSMILEDLKQG